MLYLAFILDKKSIQSLQKQISMQRKSLSTIKYFINNIKIDF